MVGARGQRRSEPAGPSVAASGAGAALAAAEVGPVVALELGYLSLPGSPVQDLSEVDRVREQLPVLANRRF